MKKGEKEVRRQGASWRTKLMYGFACIAVLLLSLKILPITFINPYGYKKDCQILRRMAKALDDNWVIIDDKIETIDSKIDTLACFSCNILTSSQTITEPGVYTAVQNVWCPITVDADNVTIDLSGYDICGTCTAITITSNRNNVTIKNGGLIGSLDCSYTCSDGSILNTSGIWVQEGSQLIDVFDMKIFGYENGVFFDGSQDNNIRSSEIRNTTIECAGIGVKSEYLIKSEIDNTKALNSTKAGFYQEYSDYNTFRNSDAIRTENDDPTQRALGFASVHGTGNLYDGCFAEGITTTTGPLGIGAIGFLFEGDETESKIINSIANSTETDCDTGLAYGIKLSAIFGSLSPELSEITAGVYDQGVTVNTTDWSPDGQYLAIGSDDNGSGPEVRVFSWDGTNLLQVASFEHGGNINSVRWSHSGDYLAIIGVVILGYPTFRVLSFDGSSLSEAANSIFFGDSVSWSPTDSYLVLASANRIRLVSFDGSSLISFSYYNHSNSGLYPVYSVDWNDDDYIVIGGAEGYGNYEVRVFQGAGLTHITDYSHSNDSGTAIHSVKWSPDGSHVVIGGTEDSVSGYEVRALSFDGSTLSPVAGYSHGINDTIYSVDWISDGNYVAIGGTEDSVTGYEVRLLRFRDSSLSDAGAGFNHGSGNIIYSVNFSPDDEYLAVGGEDSSIDGVEVRVLGVSLPLVVYFDNESTVHAVEWSSDVQYVALGGTNSGWDNSQVRVMRFNGCALGGTSYTAFDHGATVYDVSWTANGNYLAFGGQTGTNGNHVGVLCFDGTYLTELSGASYDHGATVYAVDFFSTCCMDYLAVGGDQGTGGYEVRVLAFDGQYLEDIATAQYNHGTSDSIRSLEWTTDGQYLAIAGTDGTDGYEVRVLKFSKMTLHNLENAIYKHGNTINSITWSHNFNYLAIVGQNGTGGYELRILEFSCDALIEVTSAVLDSAVAFNSVSWSPNSEYLVVGTDDTTNEVLVYSFNGYTLTLVNSHDHGATIHSVDWSQNGKYIIAGGANGNEDYDVVLFNVMDYPTANLIEGNRIANTSSLYNSVGISASGGTNLVIKNLGYENCVNFSKGISNVLNNPKCLCCSSNTGY